MNVKIPQIEYFSGRIPMFTRNKIHLLSPFCLLLILISFGVTAFGNSADENSSANGYGMTPGRVQANVAAVVGLASLVIGGVALARAAGRLGTGTGRAGAIVGLVLGLVGMVLSVVHLSRSTGGFGTG